MKVKDKRFQFDTKIAPENTPPTCWLCGACKTRRVKKASKGLQDTLRCSCCNAFLASLPFEGVAK